MNCEPAKVFMTNPSLNSLSSWTWGESSDPNAPTEALQGLFDAEGNVDGAFYHIRLRNAEMQLLKLAKHLLRKLGINSKIYTCKQQLYVKDPKSRKIYRRKQDIAYCLVISRRENIIRFTKKVGFRIRRKQKALESLLQKYKFTSIYLLNFRS